jgi:NADH-quinone oxidoreductase subunit M
VAEFPIFMGLWETQPALAVIAAISIVITAGYIMIVIRRVFFGEMPEEFEGHISPITNKDKLVLVMLAAILIVVGVWPRVMAPLVESGAQAVLAVIGGA